MASTFLDSVNSRLPSQERLKARKRHRNRQNAKYEISTRRLMKEMQEIAEEQAKIKEAQREVREKWDEDALELQDKVKRPKMMCHYGKISKVRPAGQLAGYQDVHLQRENAMLKKQLKEEKAKSKAFLERIMTLERMVKHI